MGPAIRPLAAGDSVAELTALLHRSYAALAGMGFRYLASYQDEVETRRRLDKGETFVAVHAGRLVATVTLADADRTTGSPWYDRREVASFGQFAVVPELQGQGLGSRMLDLVEHRAREKGVRELALDTAEGAFLLIRYYERRGYRFIEHVQWPRTTVNYRSVILSKTLRPGSDKMPSS